MGRLLGPVLATGRLPSRLQVPLLVSPRRTGMAARGVVGVAAALLAAVSCVLVVTSLVLALLASSLLALSLLVLSVLMAPLTGLVTVLSLLVLVATVLGRSIPLSRLLAGRLTELSSAGLFVLVSTARCVLLATLVGRTMPDLLVLGVLVARIVLSAPALLALVARVAVTLVLMPRFVVGTVVVSCHCGV